MSKRYVPKPTSGDWFVWEPETETGNGDAKAKRIVIGRKRPDMTQEVAYINCESCYFEDKNPVPVPSGLLREPYWPTAPAEAIANARLIAASPRLLRACIAAVSLYEACINAEMDGDNRLASELSTLKAAIGKAKGRPILLLEDGIPDIFDIVED